MKRNEFEISLTLNFATWHFEYCHEFIEFLEVGIPFVGDVFSSHFDRHNGRPRVCERYDFAILIGIPPGLKGGLLLLVGLFLGHFLFV